MITKAQILQLPKGAYTDGNGNLVTDNKFKIYIPIFRRAGESKDSKLSASIMYATLMYNPGCENGYKVGDVVYISFENNQMGSPVILGKLYLNKTNESVNTSLILGDNLNIVKTAILPLNTTIGSIKGEELENLFQTVANNSNLISQKQNIIDNDHKLPSDLVSDVNQTNKFVTTSEKSTWNNKQDELVSGTNIKTINGETLLGSGNIVIQGGGTITQGKGITISADGEISIDEVVVSTKVQQSRLYATKTMLRSGLADCVDLSSAQTITGEKTFSANVNISSGYDLNASNSTGYFGILYEGGTELSDKYAQITNLSSVAFSGDYDDLLNAPRVNDAILTIQVNGTKVLDFGANSSIGKIANIIVPTNVSDLHNDSGFITGIDSNMVTTALGYTPASTSSIADANLSIYVNSTKVVEFGSNSEIAKRVDLTIPTDTSDLTNGAGFTTNTGTVTSVKVEAEKGLVSTNPIASSTIYSTKITIDSNHILPTLTEWANKQDLLVSGTNIKTINNQSILGNGNITISGTSSLFMHFIYIHAWDDDGEETYNECRYSFLLPTTSNTPITSLSDLENAMPVSTLEGRRFPATSLTTDTYNTFEATSIYKGSNNNIYLVSPNSNNTRALGWWSYRDISDSVIG